MSKTFWRDTSAEIDMTYKHMKRSSLVLIMSYHHTPAVRTQINEWQRQVLARKCGIWGCREGKMVQPLGKSSVFYLLSFVKKKFFIFYRRMIALQNSVVFCQPSTWMSCRCTYIPARLNLPAISRPSHLSRWIQSPCLSFLSHTANPHWLSILRLVT